MLKCFTKGQNIQPPLVKGCPFSWWLYGYVEEEITYTQTHTHIHKLTSTHVHIHTRLNFIFLASNLYPECVSRLCKAKVISEGTLQKTTFKGALWKTSWPHNSRPETLAVVLPVHKSMFRWSVELNTSFSTTLLWRSMNSDLKHFITGKITKYSYLIK